MPINNALQSFGMNTGAFPGLSLEKSNEIREQSKLMSSNPYNQKLIQDDLHRQELSKKTHQDFMDQRQAGRMQLEQQIQTTKSSSKKNRTNSVKKMGALADMYRQYGYEHGKNWDSMGDEELVSRFNTKNPQVKQYADAFLTGGDESEYRLAQELGINRESSSWLDEKAKKDLKDNLWDSLWDNIRTKANVPIDTMKKRGKRIANQTLKQGADLVYKGILKGALGDKIFDDMGIDLAKYTDPLYERSIVQPLQEDTLNYQNEIDERYRALEQKNLDQDIENYYNNKGYTKLLKEGDFRGFLYKTVGDAAQNWEMPAVVAVSVLQPEVGFALMATDTYARENQEAFEAMMDNGATYDQAERGAVVVGLVNSAVEVGLEKLIGGVETGASKAIRDAFMKNVQQEAVKKGLGRLLTEGALQQLKASGEEGLEEIIQTIVQNAAIKTVNQNKDLFEGVGQAFEGGFYNPMNLLVGGGNLVANRTAIRDSIRGRGYNTTTDTNTSTNTNTNNQNQGILDRITDWGAEKITGTVSAQDKLYKAQEPRMNTLTSKKDLERRRGNSDRANQLIVENGYTPTNTAERLEAHKATLDKIWNQVKSKINEGKGVTVDQTSIINALENYINEKKSLNVAAIEGDIAALEKELESLKQSQEQGTADLPVLENKKQVYNDIANWKEHEASKVYNDGIKLITSEIGKIEDNLLSQIPGEFSNLKKDVGALIDSYEDVFKADMKNQRSKGMGITEAYSRIEGVGDIIEGAMGIFKGEGGKVLKGAGKVLLGKSLAKAKDVDFLIEQGFKELAKQYGNNGNIITNTTPTTPTATAPTTKTTTEITEDIDVGENPTDLTATEGVMEEEVTTAPKKKATKKKTSKKQTAENKTKKEANETLDMMKGHTEEENRRAYEQILGYIASEKAVLDNYDNYVKVGYIQSKSDPRWQGHEKSYKALVEQEKEWRANLEKLYGKTSKKGLDKNQASSKTDTDMQKTKLNTNTDTSDMVKVSKTNTEGNEIANATKGKSNFVDFNDIDLNNRKEYVWRLASEFDKSKMQYHDITHFTNERIDRLDAALRTKNLSKGVTPEDFKASYTLGEILDNPALYEKYPTLKDKIVMFVDFHTKRAYGVNIGDTIFMNSKYYLKDKGLGNSTLVHEIEHDIQKIEGTWVDNELDQFMQRFGKEYVENPNEIGARNKQKEYLNFIGRGDEKMRWE